MRLPTIPGLLLALSLGACTGGKANGPVGASDAAVPEMDAGVVCAGCNAVTQACCDVGEKCARLVESEDPYLARTACVPAGLVPLGKTCSRGEAGYTGFDDCAAGLHCLHGVCARICAKGPPDSCRASDEPEGTGSYCTLLEDVFWDNTGVCVQVPDHHSGFGKRLLGPQI